MGGAQRSMLEVCSLLPACGVEVVAAVPPGPLFDRLTQAGITVYPVSAVRARRRGWNFFSSTAKLLRAPAGIRPIIRAVRPDIVHANSLTALMAAGHATSKRLLFWHVRDLVLPPILAREASRRATRIIAISEAVDEFLADILSQRVLGRIRVIRNGIDPDRFQPGDKAAARRTFDLPANAPIIGMVAHLIPWKRHDAFIEAASLIRQRHPDAFFVVVGRDLFQEHARWVAQLEQRVAQLNLQDRFRWIRDLDDSSALLPALDLLLHPALQEPFGRVVCEALATETPVVATASAGPAAIIQHRVTGLLAPHGEPTDLAEAAIKLLDDPARATRMGKAGRERVLAHYTTRSLCEQLAQEYRSAMAVELPQRETHD